MRRNTGIAASQSSENPQDEDSYAGSLHEGGEATSRSMPAAPYCQRLHKRQLYEGGAVHTYAGSSYYRCKFSLCMEELGASLHASDGVGR